MCLDVTFMKQSVFQDSQGLQIPMECLIPLLGTKMVARSEAKAVCT